MSPKRGTRLIGYGRVSTREQGDSGLGLDAQRAVIDMYCERLGIELATWLTDVASGKTTDGRLGLDTALASCTAGVADGVIVAKLDRLARSVYDFANILKRAQAEGWTLVIVDIGLDLSTPAGKMVAQIMAAVAEWERDIISARTKDALTEVRRRGKALGRPSGVDDATIARIIRERAAGKGLWRIARDLTLDGVPTPQRRELVRMNAAGEMVIKPRAWQHATVRYILERYGDYQPEQPPTPGDDTEDAAG